MKKRFLKRIIFLLLIPIILLSFRQQDETAYASYHVLFAGASTDFHQLDSVAKVLSKSTGIEYKNTLVYDSKRGMILPDSSNDEIYAGSYFPRRETEERISIEMAQYYLEGNIEITDPKRMMCIVAGIYRNKNEANAKLPAIQKTVKDAYVKKVKLYQGCMR